ncbi:helix-turn-helix domain-containing protein [Acetobacter conturbans]
MEALAQQAEASVRTLARLALEELGCSLSAWRQQADVLAAVPMLVSGQPVGLISEVLGYETPSAFAAIFRRIIGGSPTTYRSAQHPG